MDIPGKTNYTNVYSALIRYLKVDRPFKETAEMQDDFIVKPNA